MYTLIRIKFYKGIGFRSSVHTKKMNTPVDKVNLVRW